MVRCVFPTPHGLSLDGLSLDSFTVTCVEYNSPVTHFLSEPDRRDTFDARVPVQDHRWSPVTYEHLSEAADGNALVL